VNQLRLFTVRLKSSHQSLNKAFSTIEQLFERHTPRDSRIIKEQYNLSATREATDVGAARIECFLVDLFPRRLPRGTNTLGLMWSENRERNIVGG
jgi:hypothetical protein